MTAIIDIISNHPALAGFLLFVFSVLCWFAYDYFIRPSLIPNAEIVRIADDLIERHGSRAEEIAAMNEDRAWRYCDEFEQGKWRRVRKELQRRQFTGDRE